MRSARANRQAATATPCEHGLEPALRRQLLNHGRLERCELGGVLVRQHDVFLCTHAVLERILRRAR